MNQVTSNDSPAIALNPLDRPAALKTGATARPLTAAARTAAYVSAGAAGLFLALLAALHVVKPELDPAWRMISEYAVGDYGWMMRLAFFSLALSCAGLGVALRAQTRTTSGKIGLALLAVVAAALGMAGVFDIDPVTAGPQALTTHGQLHGLAAMIGNPGFALAAVLVSVSLARSPVWAPARPALFVTANLIWISLLLMFATLFVTLARTGGAFGPEVVVGWPNRLVVVAYCAWLLTVARQAIRLSRAGA